MSYDMDGDKMVQVLRIGREKMSDKGTKSANKRVDPLRSQTGLSRAAIIDTMIETFRSLHGLDATRPSTHGERKFGTEEPGTWSPEKFATGRVDWLSCGCRSAGLAQSR